MAASRQSDVILDDGGLSVNDGVILSGDDAGLLNRQSARRDGSFE